MNRFWRKLLVMVVGSLMLLASYVLVVPSSKPPLAYLNIDREKGIEISVGQDQYSSSINVNVKGSFPNYCYGGPTTFTQTWEAKKIVIQIYNLQPSPRWDVRCPQALIPKEYTFKIGEIYPGTYIVSINGIERTVIVPPANP